MKEKVGNGSEDIDWIYMLEQKERKKEQKKTEIAIVIIAHPADSNPILPLYLKIDPIARPPSRSHSHSG